MKSVRKMLTAVLLILVMVTVLAGCGKKEEEKATRRERRSQNEKNEEKDKDKEVTEAPVTDIPTAAPVTAEPTMAAIDTPTPIPTGNPAVPEVYLAEFNSLEDLKFIRSEILGKDLKEVLDILENKYNIAVIRDSAVYSIQDDFSNVRFEWEFERAKAHNAKTILLVEDATWENLLNGRYRSKFNPNAFAASLCAYLSRYDIVLIFCKAESTGRIIHDLLYYDLRQRIMEGQYDTGRD